MSSHDSIIADNLHAQLRRKNNSKSTFPDGACIRCETASAACAKPEVECASAGSSGCLPKLRRLPVYFLLDITGDEGGLPSGVCPVGKAEASAPPRPADQEKVNSKQSEQTITVNTRNQKHNRRHAHTLANSSHIQERYNGAIKEQNFHLEYGS